MSALTLAASANAQSLLVRPSLNTRATFSDNINASSRNEKSDLVLEATPAIALLREEGRVTGRLNAMHRNVMHLSESDRDTSFISLQGNGQIEAVRDRLFLDLAASTSRNSTTAVLGRGSQDFLNTDSSDETRQFSIGPRVLFRLGDAEGSASHRLKWFDGGGALLKREVAESDAGLSDPTAFGRSGWGLSYERTDTSYDDSPAGDFTEEVARATLFLNVSRKLRLRGIFGHESSNFLPGETEKGTFGGGGFDWQPTPRTQVAGNVEDRFFGRSYSLDFSHRRPRSVWDFSLTRNVTSSTEPDGSVFGDPAFRSLYDALATELPDPLQREAFVRVLLGYPAPSARSGFVTNNYYVSRTMRGSFSLIGVRNTLTFSLQRSDNARLGDPLVEDVRDDFAEFEKVEIDTATISLIHELTAQTSLNARLSRSRAKGARTDENADTRRSTLAVGVSRRLGPNTNGALTYRHQRATGTTEYTENVLTASLGLQF